MSLIDTPYFCVVPWIHFFSHTNGTIQACCMSDITNNNFGNIKSNIKDIWNSDTYINFRKTILSGNRYKICEPCYKQEELGNDSQRNLLNMYYLNPKLEEYINNHMDGICDTIDIKFLDIRFSNKCNFKCRMCAPRSSSRWNNGIIFDGITDINKWFNENVECLKNLELIYIAGGEPFITDQHYELLECCIDHKIFPTIFYQTNGSVIKYKNWNIKELWKSFNIKYNVSIDAIGGLGEYIRTGYKDDVVNSNINTIKKYFNSINEYNKIFLNITCQAYNIFFITEILDEIEKREWTSFNNIFIQTLINPDFFQSNVLPTKLKNEAIEKIISSKWYKQYPDKFGSILNNLRSESTPAVWEKFKTHIKHLDEMENTSIFDHFPQLYEYIID